MDVDMTLCAWLLLVHGASIARRAGEGRQVRVSVIGEGRLRAPYADDVEHYRKLLSRYVELQLLPLRDADAVARRLPPQTFVCLLTSEGRLYDSVAFSELIDRWRQHGREVAFVVGGAFGPPPLARVDHELSLGPMTLPHQLAWVLLLEQLYRAHKILAREPYHY
jgi:23S rRNA (pseudouridine1915-N3)-methyltransferase